MKIGGFSLFEKDSGGSRAWAAWHSPHSLTWRWSIRVSWRSFQSKPFYFQRDHRNAGSATYAGVPGLAVYFTTQRPMWYRDLYIRRRDEFDRAQNEVISAHQVVAEMAAAKRGEMH